MTLVNKPQWWSDRQMSMWQWLIQPSFFGSQYASSEEWIFRGFDSEIYINFNCWLVCVLRLKTESLSKKWNLSKTGRILFYKHYNLLMYLISNILPWVVGTFPICSLVKVLLLCVLNCPFHKRVNQLKSISISIFFAII